MRLASVILYYNMLCNTRPPLNKWPDNKRRPRHANSGAGHLLRPAHNHLNSIELAGQPAGRPATGGRLVRAATSRPRLGPAGPDRTGRSGLLGGGETREAALRAGLAGRPATGGRIERARPQRRLMVINNASKYHNHRPLVARKRIKFAGMWPWLWMKNELRFRLIAATCCAPGAPGGAPLAASRPPTGRQLGANWSPTGRRGPSADKTIN